MKGHLYQLKDSDGDNAGLVHSDYEYDDTFMEARWNEYINSCDDNGVDEFVEWFNQSNRPNIERVYVTEIFQK